MIDNFVLFIRNTCWRGNETVIIFLRAVEIGVRRLLDFHVRLNEVMNNQSLIPTTIIQGTNVIYRCSNAN